MESFRRTFAIALLAVGWPTVAAAQDLHSVPGLHDRVAQERSVVHHLLEAGECPRSCLALALTLVFRRRRRP